ncbi:hypothetical protein P691DRAFT_760203 [Macrolepiota fuliginosa MF-IS2]|uniref:Uncharacterized protein n=1 Tax=Macrolepiota fuliginosa MF-IS2 TaxID=1400762 RepID=A0A9P6C1S7_9AGAR|nr:hypothetical protein P691DRAFT_760203 [Macrolepiota fuliginosa MF-IS2]
MLSIVTFFLTLIAFDSLLCVRAGLWIVNPRQGSTCHGGQPCTVDWLDDGQSPLLSVFGVATVGLYTGKQQLVQVIEPVDVTKVHSLTFTPLADAGPNSDTYYISFISTSLRQNGSLSSAFSPFFSLDKMTGSFTTPDPSATSSIPVPSSITAGGKPTEDGDVLSTITVGTLSTSSSPTPTSTSTSASVHSTTTISSSTHSGTAIAVTSTSTSAVSISSTTKTSSTKPSGFSTAVLSSPTGPSSTFSLTLTLSESPSSTIASPSVSALSSALSSPSSVSTSGAVGLGLGQGTGISLALTAMILVLVL